MEGLEAEIHNVHIYADIELSYYPLLDSFCPDHHKNHRRFFFIARLLVIVKPLYTSW